MSSYCTVKSMTGGQHEELPKTLYICRTVLYMRLQLLNIWARRKFYQLVSIVMGRRLGFVLLTMSQTEVTALLHNKISKGV